MNGEDSSDNWRKYKMVKLDSKKYINKSDIESKKKEISSSDLINRDIISKDKDLKTKITEKAKSEIILEQRKNEENNLKLKENIDTQGIDVSNLNSEHKQQVEISEEHKVVIEGVDASEDRNKCKENKKCDSNCECKEIKNDKCQKEECIEDSIIKLGKKLDTYHGVIDFKINNLHEDMMIYGFIKNKNDCNCKWKKFKVETAKCRNENEIESEEFDYIPYSVRRIEENFRLDKSDSSNRIDRLDIIDFDGYENEIQQLGTTNAGQTATGMMGQTTKSEEQMGMTNNTQINTENVIPTTQTATENVEQLKKTPVEQTTSTEQVQKPSTPTQQFNITGEIGLYFEKIAEDFEPYESCLSDVNYCKLYKINVYSIDQLSDDSNYNKYTLAYYPMFNYYPYISKEGHYLLGYKCNKDGELKYIVYAIPGDKDKSCQPYGGRTGFVTWTTDKKNDKGYWLMFYDFRNSSIVIPTK